MAKLKEKDIPTTKITKKELSMKYICFITVCLLFSSCDFFYVNKKKNNQLTNSIIDFSKVDASPSFIECKDKIDAERVACFRTNIHQKISKNLTIHPIKIKGSIDEVIKVHLLINSKGKVYLKEVISSNNIKTQIPNMDSLIKMSVDKLPKISPALKRSIPVNTQYQLPIRIYLRK